MNNQNPFGQTWFGLDFLRGLGIFLLLIMHTAFYYYSGIWEVDFDNPPLIITIIGLLLMFAGLFAMISGAVHGLSMARLSIDNQWTPEQIWRKKWLTGLFILITAYLYFIFTGPGLADFSASRMNNSILVEWLRQGRLTGTGTERLLYVDSLVMIGSNIILVSLVWIILIRLNRLRPGWLLALSGVVMLISLVRLPLYSYYLEQVEKEQWLAVLALFWLVNKNNPVLPFLAFGLLGSWLGLLLHQKKSLRPAVILGLAAFVTGVFLYILLPDTMLQREIDLKWYSIMIAQLGLFVLLIVGSVKVFDRGKRDGSGNQKLQNITLPFRLICLFSRGGLTAFFWESVLSAFVWRFLLLLRPDLQLGLAGALIFGAVMAIFWLLILVLWQSVGFAGSIEHIYGLLVRKYGGASSKLAKLKTKLM